MNVYGSSLVVNIDGPRAPAERLSHPKDGALAQQPKAERAPHSAVVRPQTMVALARADPGQKWTGTVRHFAHHCVAMAKCELKECWFKPTRRRRSQRFLVQRFLVQDRLRASDVLHRYWDWSRWL
jgi:hypothetical protein